MFKTLMFLYYEYVSPFVSAMFSDFRTGAFARLLKNISLCTL